jgi:uncharacterized OB-fold protein
VSDSSRAFWDATRRRELLLQWCEDCGRAIFYPRAMCPACLGTSFQWREASGEGRVYAVSVQYRPAMPLPAFQEGPYAVALVELAEGPRLMSGVVGCDPEQVQVGMPVRLTWEELSDGRNLPLFEPAGGR